jgi:putative acetyltransferase
MTIPTIRPERPGDADGIRAVHAAAFPTDLEARLVERLRDSAAARVSLVAQVDGHIVGHIVFSPVTVNGQRIAGALGLAPVAVAPKYQRQGIGGQLIRAGLVTCRELGCGFVVLLGHPEYYPRFGFQQASRFGLTNEYGADEAFMVLELQPGAIPPGGGLVRYGSEFAGLE